MTDKPSIVEEIAGLARSGPGRGCLIMERCEGKTGGICTRPATWKQSVHAGNRAAGRLLYHAYWCDEHAERVAEKRRLDWIAPPRMMRIAQVEA